jgi:hypothetical protein
MDDKEICRIRNSIHRMFRELDESARAWSNSLLTALKKDPNEGIKLIFRSYGQAVEDVYGKDPNVSSGYILAMAGGPHEAIPRSIANSVGAVYPYLTRDQKDLALQQLLNIFDRQNWIQVQRIPGYTPGIREPTLLADIAIARPIYWPGLDHQNQKLVTGSVKVDGDDSPVRGKGKFKTFREFRDACIDNDGIFKSETVESDFIIAYSILRSDFSDWGDEYCLAADQEFLDRVMRGIVAMRFAPRRFDKSPRDIEQGTKRLEELLPRFLHNKVEPIRLQADWADVKKFP